jgi:hypothetical protein
MSRWQPYELIKIGDTALRVDEQAGAFRVLSTGRNLEVFAALIGAAVDDATLDGELDARRPFRRAGFWVEEPVASDADDVAPATRWWTRYLDEDPGPMCMVCNRNDRLPIPWSELASLCRVARGEHARWQATRDTDAKRARTRGEWLAQVAVWGPRRPLAGEPDDADRAELAELETIAAAIDELAAVAEPTVETLAAASAKRRFFLPRLEARGILDDRAEPAVVLERLGLARLASYHRAARELAGYLRSPERAKELPEAAPVPPIAASISLDWFRFPPVLPAKGTPAEWLAWCEKELEDLVDETPTFKFIKHGSLRASLSFRIEDGFRFVLHRAEIAL